MIKNALNRSATGAADRFFDDISHLICVRINVHRNLFLDHLTDNTELSLRKVNQNTNGLLKIFIKKGANKEIIESVLIYKTFNSFMTKVKNTI